jgi:isoleucyl-tRNA synthetase
VFTAEEAFEHRHGCGAGSVHHGHYVSIPADWRNVALEQQFATLLALRDVTNDALEGLRATKAIGSFLQADLVVTIADPADAQALAGLDPAEHLLVASVTTRLAPDGPRFAVSAGRTALARCDRCWRHLPDVAADTGLCTRCTHAVAAHPALAAPAA